MGPILNGYGVMGIFYFPYTPSCEPRLRNQLSVALQPLLLPADSPTPLQIVQFPYLDTWAIRGRWGGIRLATS